jgi:hypothetical protein
MTAGSNAVTGTATTWTTEFPANVDFTFANIFLTVNPPGGDGLQYQIKNFQDNTHLTLLEPVVNATIPSGSSFSIGQYPLLSPNFHDAIVYGALRVYFNSIVKDADKYQLYNQLYNERLELMKFYLATKQVSVDLGSNPLQQNPNLFLNGIFQTLP